jgi:hypothetical protein
MASIALMVRDLQEGSLCFLLGGRFNSPGYEACLRIPVRGYLRVDMLGREPERLETAGTAEA